LLKNAALPHPELGELQNQILKSEPLNLPLKFYFRFQAVSKSSLVFNFRSV